MPRTPLTPTVETGTLRGAEGTIPHRPRRRSTVHLQIRSVPAKSPPNLADFLQVLVDADINLGGASGSNVESGGEFAFAVEDGQEDAAMSALEAADYHPRLVEPKVCLLEDEPGQLLDCIGSAISENEGTGRVIKDILVGARKEDGLIVVQVYSEEPGQTGDVR
jgi:hypothetical protein